MSATYTATCGRCRAQVTTTDPYNWAEHENVCPSTLAELDRLKKQNAELIIELTKLRALQDGVVKLMNRDFIDVDTLVDRLVKLLEALR